MSVAGHRRGGAPVGYLEELPDIESSAVLYLRLWSDGREARAQVWNDFAITLGQTQGRVALKSFERLFSLAAQHGRRPLMRHDVTCRCLGADEAAFANFVGAAAAGDREDAMLIATLLVRSDMASTITDLAEQFGFALRRILLRANRQGPTAHHTSQSLH